MRLFLLPLLFVCLAAPAWSLEAVANSTSPNGKFHIAIEEPSGPDEMAQYRVVNRDGPVFSEGFASDYQHGAKNTSIFWRSDGAYFVLQEPADRHHEAFYVAMRYRDGYVPFLFNRSKPMNATGLKYAFAYVTFDQWLPQDRIALTIRGQWMGDLTTEHPYECGFVLDLKDGLRVVSFEIRRPTPAERAKIAK